MKLKRRWKKALQRGDQAIAEGREAVDHLRVLDGLTNDLSKAIQALA